MTYRHTDETGDELTLRSVANSAVIHTPSSLGVVVDAEDAPGLAAAILEATGTKATIVEGPLPTVGGPDHDGDYFASVDGATEYAHKSRTADELLGKARVFLALAKAAQEREVGIDAEAKAARQAYFGDSSSLVDWRYVGENERDRWRRVAKANRGEA